ncbi:MAG TPA: TonB family protein [Pyrinomonadaceae bacterium]|nr:TonB family protein [Pyrinomonadaceae bacterium]
MTRRLRFVFVTLVVTLCVAPTFLAQTSDDLDSTARARIEEARNSIVLVKAENESDHQVSQALGFLIRSDLVATDASVLSKASRVSVTVPAKQSTLRVLTPGHYFLPYVLLQKQSEIVPLRLGDSEAVAVNDKVYMIDDQAIAAGTVTGKITMNGTDAFLISLAITSSNKGAPIFNGNGEVIGIAAENPNGGAGVALPSSLLATLTHLGEPGVGVGAGDGRLQPVRSTPTDTNTSSTSPVDQKPVRLKAPAPQYTEAARANKTQGTVTLRVLVGADGTVQQVRVVRGLPDGLTEQAVAAAREAKFKPAMKDGKPVPCWVGVEMSFNIR